MTTVRTATALATLAIVFGYGGAAQADPFTDSPISVSRVATGTADNGIVLMSLFDDGDNGSDATELSDYNSLVYSTYTTLGIDQKGTVDKSDDVGGVLVVAFDDNICLADVGMDLDVYDGGNDESALVEVSNDGVNFYRLGEVTPAGYELDADGTVPFFTQVRITASDRNGLNAAGWDFSAGIDVDTVECLNSIDAQGFVQYVDTCDVTSADPGLDVDQVLVHTDGFSAYVDLYFCGAVVDGAQYAVNFGNGDVVVTTTTTTESTTDTKGKKKKKSSAGHGIPDHARDRVPEHVRDKMPGGTGDTPGGGECGMAAGHSVTYSNGVDNGGLVFVDGNHMSIEVSYAEMSAYAGDQLMLWVETSDGSLVDTAPTADASDGCELAETAAETVPFTLQ